MAVGDVVSVIGTAPAGGNFDYQPSAGVEIAIWGLAPSSSGLTGKLYDGVNEVDVAKNNTLGHIISDTTLLLSAIRLLITNSLYLRIYNSSAYEIKVAYWGVQTK